MKCCFGAKNATVSSRNVVIDEGAEQKVVRAEQDVAKTDASVKESALAAQIRADMYETAAFEGTIENNAFLTSNLHPNPTLHHS